MLTMIALAASLAGQASTDSMLAVVRRAAEPFADTAAARAAGFVPLGRGRFTDRTPFQGQHWLHTGRILSGDTVLAEPTFLMYAEAGGGLKLMGVAYSARIGHDDPTPLRFAGHEAPWHLHQACFAVPGEGVTLADGVDDCRQRGGRPTPRQTAMVHVWSGESSPDGLFAHDNPALPYVAVGLTPPPAAVWADHHQAMDARALALALGETYEARFGYAKRIEAMNTVAGLTDSLSAHRRRIADAIPALREAERRGDQAAYATAAHGAVKEWEALRALYRQMAQTDELRAQLDKQYEQALGVGHRH